MRDRKIVILSDDFTRNVLFVQRQTRILHVTASPQIVETDDTQIKIGNTRP